MDSERDRRKIKALVAAEKAQAASSLAKALTAALSKEEQARSLAERTLIKKNAELAKTIAAKIEVKRRKKQIAEERSSEVVDPPEVLEQKIQELASLIREATSAANSNSKPEPCWSPGRSPLVTKQRSQASNQPQQPAQASVDAFDAKELTNHGPVLSPPPQQESLSDGDASSPDMHSQLGPQPGESATTEDASPSPKRWAQRSFHGGGVVVHTGAGLSTTAGIPDFRGPNGVWTLQSKGQQSDSCAGLSYERVAPTTGHMVLAAMHAQGLVKHLVSQNVDGLHLRSGIPKACVSELHGCVFQEQCKACGAKFLRPFDVTVPQGSSFHRHKTGRTCGGDAQPGAARAHRGGGGSGGVPQGGLPSVKEESEGSVPAVNPASGEGESGGEGDEKENPGHGPRVAPGCGGTLLDTIVHFNECLDADELSTATEMSTGADLALCLGSSFKVPPANKLPKLARRVVVVNLQWTPLDRVAALKIHGRLDQVLARLAQLLGVQWAPYSPLQDPILGERFLKLQESGEEALASRLFMKHVRAAQPPKEEEGAGKGPRKKRRSIYAQPKRMKRISFPQPAKC